MTVTIVTMEIVEHHKPKSRVTMITIGSEESTIASDKLMSSFRQWVAEQCPRNRVNKLVSREDSSACSALFEINGQQIDFHSEDDYTEVLSQVLVLML